MAMLEANVQFVDRYVVDDSEPVELSIVPQHPIGHFLKSLGTEHCIDLDKRRSRARSSIDLPSVLRHFGACVAHFDVSFVWSPEGEHGFDTLGGDGYRGPAAAIGARFQSG
jgi:hypothetical protein